MSGITPAGQLATLVRGYALTGAESVRFLRHLRCYVAERLLVIWDGSPIHRSRAVKSYLANGGAPAVHLERLPPTRQTSTRTKACGSTSSESRCGTCAAQTRPTGRGGFLRGSALHFYGGR